MYCHFSFFCSLLLPPFLPSLLPLLLPPLPPSSPPSFPPSFLYSFLPSLLPLLLPPLSPSSPPHHSNKQKLVNYRLVRDKSAKSYYIHVHTKFSDIRQLLEHYSHNPINADANTRLLYPITPAQETDSLDGEGCYVVMERTTASEFKATWLLLPSSDFAGLESLGQVFPN